ncbi:MAG: hypothetical protein KC933_26870 [Myxococcales bacterium]|nr:hypothetical protein [Myxococcales bacterium]
MVEVLSGRNYGINDAGCEFPTAEDPFEGVRFWVLHDEVIISVAEFHRFVREACAAQAKRLPQQADALEAVLAKLPPTAP